jgi:hypothetical protein
VYIFLSSAFLFHASSEILMRLKSAHGPHPRPDTQHLFGLVAIQDWLKSTDAVYLISLFFLLNIDLLSCCYLWPACAMTNARQIYYYWMKERQDLMQVSTSTVGHRFSSALTLAGRKPPRHGEIGQTGPHMSTAYVPALYHLPPSTACVCLMKE